MEGVSGENPAETSRALISRPLPVIIVLFRAKEVKYRGTWAVAADRNGKTPT
jgi:hypothetical protein